LEDWIKTIVGSDNIHYKWYVDAEQDAKSMITRKEREGLEIKRNNQLYNIVESVAESLSTAKSYMKQLKEILGNLKYNIEIRKFKLNEKYCAKPECNCIHKMEPIISNVQCGVDTFITAKMVEMSCTNKINTVILLTADADFHPAIQIMRDYNVDLVVIGTNISEMLRSDKNCRCVEIPDVVFNEISKFLNNPE